MLKQKYNQSIIWLAIIKTVTLFTLSSLLFAEQGFSMILIWTKYKNKILVNDWWYTKKNCRDIHCVYGFTAEIEHAIWFGKWSHQIYTMYSPSIFTNSISTYLHLSFFAQTLRYSSKRSTIISSRYVLWKQKLLKLAMYILYFSLFFN